MGFIKNIADMLSGKMARKDILIKAHYETLATRSFRIEAPPMVQKWILLCSANCFMLLEDLIFEDGSKIEFNLFSTYASRLTPKITLKIYSAFALFFLSIFLKGKNDVFFDETEIDKGYLEEKVINFFSCTSKEKEFYSRLIKAEDPYFDFYNLLLRDYFSLSGGKIKNGITLIWFMKVLNITYENFLFQLSEELDKEGNTRKL